MVNQKRFADMYNVDTIEAQISSDAIKLAHILWPFVVKNYDDLSSGKQWQFTLTDSCKCPEGIRQRVSEELAKLIVGIEFEIKTDVILLSFRARVGDEWLREFERKLEKCSDKLLELFKDQNAFIKTAEVRYIPEKFEEDIFYLNQNELKDALEKRLMTVEGQKLKVSFQPMEDYKEYRIRVSILY
jgi:hypothetical protein